MGMVTDPRTGETVSLDNAAALWDEVTRELHHDCDVQPRRWTLDGGATAIYGQCVICGRRRGNAMRADGKTYPDADHGLEARFGADYTARRNEIIIKYLDDQDGKDTEWWSIYNAYLASPEWQARRAKVLKRCGGVCEGCGDAPATEVHHTTYEHVTEEFLFELLGLCHACHKRIHAEGGPEPFA